MKKTDDLISRQAVLDALGNIDCSDGVGFSALKYDAINEAVTAIKALPSAQPDIDVKFLIRTITTGIMATDTQDVYSCGMRNGMRWCRSLIDGKEPLYENCPYAQPEII